MKRGLKDDEKRIVSPETLGSNHCPDEKGTERYLTLIHILAVNTVATIAPMKRGLKVTLILALRFSTLVATIAPMKRGLKDR